MQPKSKIRTLTPFNPPYFLHPLIRGEIERGIQKGEIGGFITKNGITPPSNGKCNQKWKTLIIGVSLLLFTGCTQVSQTQAPTQTTTTATQVNTTPAPAPATEPVNTGQASAIANIKEILPDPNTITLKTNSPNFSQRKNKGNETL